MSPNSVEVCINEMHYHITTKEPSEYLHDLAREIDGQIRLILERNASMTFNDAAVLCMINYADAYRRSEESADHMRTQISDYLEDAAKARVALDETKRHLVAAERDRAALSQELERYREKAGQSAGSVVQ